MRSLLETICLSCVIELICACERPLTELWARLGCPGYMVRWYLQMLPKTKPLTRVSVHLQTGSVTLIYASPASGASAVRDRQAALTVKT